MATPLMRLGYMRRQRVQNSRILHISFDADLSAAYDAA
jgi:hypothetical protein